MNEEDRGFLESDITMEELKKAVNELDESKACGLDKITPQMLKKEHGPRDRNKITSNLQHSYILEQKLKYSKKSTFIFKILLQRIL